MLRYWNLTERERSELDDAGVRAMLDVERMEKGLVKPRPPELETIEDVDLPRSTYYRVRYDGGRYGSDHFDAIFDSPDEAHQFCAGRPLATSHHYEASENCVVTPTNLRVEAVEYPTQDELNRVKPIVLENKNKIEANRKAQEAYDKAAREWDEGANEIWEDWRRCLDTSAKHEEVRRCFADYVETAEGDHETAERFIRKAFDRVRIEEARQWFGCGDPLWGVDEAKSLLAEDES